MPERSFAAALLIIIVSLLLFGLIVWCERFVVKWQPKAEGESSHA
jgi:ABC-type nitrate/sulfonate/bicarbonate transport system permease component